LYVRNVTRERFQRAVYKGKCSDETVPASVFHLITGIYSQILCFLPEGFTSESVNIFR